MKHLIVIGIIAYLLISQLAGTANGDSPNVGPVVVNRCDHGNRVYVTESINGSVALAVATPGYGCKP